MKKSNQKVLISGYYGFNNFGDDAVLSTLVQSLKNADINDITVFSKNPEETSKTFNVKSSYTFDFLGLIRNISKCDFLISGGGSLLQDTTSLKSLIYYLFVIFTALFFKKKVIIFAQGIGPINNKFFAFVTKLILKNCDYVSVRDEQSLKLLREWGISAYLIADPVWNIDLRTFFSHHAVGIQLREWKDLDKNTIKKLAQILVENYSDKLICIYIFQDSQDAEVCALLEEEICKANLYIQVKLIFYRNIYDIAGSLSHIDELISMRFHASLIGLKYGSKVLPIVYDPKVEKLADEFEIKDRLYLNNTDDWAEKIKNLRYGSYYVNSDKIKNKNFDFAQFERFLKE